MWVFWNLILCIHTFYMFTNFRFQLTSTKNSLKLISLNQHWPHWHWISNRMKWWRIHINRLNGLNTVSWCLRRRQTPTHTNGWFSLCLSIVSMFVVFVSVCLSTSIHRQFTANSSPIYRQFSSSFEWSSFTGFTPFHSSIWIWS